MRFFKDYLKYRKKSVYMYLLFVAIFLLTFSLYHLPAPAVLYPAALCALIAIAFAAADYRREKKRRETLSGIKEAGIELCEKLPEAISGLEESYREMVFAFCGEYMRAAEKSRVAYEEMMNYYTLWAHQIKTPIASMRLQLQNEDSEFSRKLQSDLGRIEQYVSMVLTYLRLGSDSTDYVFREYDLDDIVRPAVKKLSGDFIGKKLSLEYKPLHTTVLTDEKWLFFVIEQLLTNAVKYTQNGTVSIYMEPPKTLCIKDTGIGIAPEDLPRVFEQGYTGFNGRADMRASGIGLYLCRRITSNLGHKLTAESALGKGTTLRIDLETKKRVTE